MFFPFFFFSLSLFGKLKKVNWIKNREFSHRAVFVFFFTMEEDNIILSSSQVKGKHANLAFLPGDFFSPVVVWIDATLMSRQEKKDFERKIISVLCEQAETAPQVNPVTKQKQLFYTKARRENWLKQACCLTGVHFFQFQDLFGLSPDNHDPFPLPENIVNELKFPNSNNLPNQKNTTKIIKDTISQNKLDNLWDLLRRCAQGSVYVLCRPGELAIKQYSRYLDIVEKAVVLFDSFKTKILVADAACCVLLIKKWNEGEMRVKFPDSKDISRKVEKGMIKRLKRALRVFQSLDCFAKKEIIIDYNSYLEWASMNTYEMLRHQWTVREEVELLSVVENDSNEKEFEQRNLDFTTKYKATLIRTANRIIDDTNQKTTKYLSSLRLYNSKELVQSYYHLFFIQNTPNETVDSVYQSSLNDSRSWPIARVLITNHSDVALLDLVRVFYAMLVMSPVWCEKLEQLVDFRQLDKKDFWSEFEDFIQCMDCSLYVDWRVENKRQEEMMASSSEDHSEESESDQDSYEGYLKNRFGLY